jgi:hypothetical protein
MDILIDYEQEVGSLYIKQVKYRYAESKTFAFP